MIVNQMGGGTSGDAWNHHTDSLTKDYKAGDSYVYDFSGKEEGVKECLACGTTSFLDSNGKTIAFGKFASAVVPVGAFIKDDIYINKVSASGNGVQYAGNFLVAADSTGYEVRVIQNHSSPLSNVVTVKTVIDIFWR